MAEADTNGPFSNRRLSLIILSVGMIFLAGFPIFTTAVESGCMSQSGGGTACPPSGPRRWSGWFATPGTAGGRIKTTTSTTLVSTGSGWSFFLPIPSYNISVPVGQTQADAGNAIILFGTGWTDLSSNVTDARMAMTIVFSITGIPSGGSVIPNTDDQTGLVIGTEPLGNPLAPAQQALPITFWLEVNSPMGRLVPGTKLFIYFAISSPDGAPAATTINLTKVQIWF